MTCDDCYFSELCHTRIAFGMGLDSIGHEDDQIEKSCKRFKNRNLIVELPCKVGDTVYVIGDNKVEERTVEYFVITESCVNACLSDFMEYDIDEIFLTRDDAERALREREE